MFSAAARGAGLIALAVGLGLVLLQIGDDGAAQLTSSSKPVAPVTTGPAPQSSTSQTSSTSSSTSSSTTAVSTTATTATSTTSASAGPAPRDVDVLVLNATGRPNQARPLSAKLQAAGYRTLEPGDAPVRDGSVVFCRHDFAAAAAALVTATGFPATTGDLDAHPLLGARPADCVVIIGVPSPGPVPWP